MWYSCSMRIAASTKPRPGYVYALESPALPGLVKVGHTNRPPHRRAAELSRTALPLPFEVRHARFFWNAPGVELGLHRYFASYRPNRRREFFELPLQTIASAMDELDHSLGMSRQPLSEHDLDAPFSWRVADPDWSVSREGLEEQWEWAEEELNSSDTTLHRRGWSRMEALSAAGWDEGSWRLADVMMRRSPTNDTAHRAAWVLDAAACQGHPAAALRAHWLRSFWGDSEFAAWKQAVVDLENSLGARDPLSWPEGIRDTLEAEAGLWSQVPVRRLDSPLFRKLDTMPRSVQTPPPGRAHR